jgi:signal transduction histidine kinase/ActR/RegA family two-component response regulator
MTSPTATKNARFSPSPYRSIGTKLLVSVLGGACIGLGAMSFLVYQALESQSRNEIRKTLHTEVLKVENQLNQVKQYTAGSGIAIQAAQKSTNAQEYADLVFEFFKQRPQLVMGSGFAQSSYGILKNKEWFLPYFYVDQGAADSVGKLLPAPYSNIRYLDVQEVEQYSEAEYYKFAVNSGKPAWLEPYDWYGMTMTTYSYPFRDKNSQIIGYAMADLNVTAITQQIKGKVIHDQGYFAILSDKGNLLGYPPDPAKAKKRTNYQEVPELKAIWSQIQSQPSGLLVTNGKFWAYERIPATGWLMIADVPQSVVLIPVLGITLGGALAAGIVLIAVVLWFVRRLNHRLQPIIEGCNQLAQTEDNEILSAESGAMDELEILSISFDRMKHQLQESFAVLEQRVEERTVELQAAKLTADSANHAKSEFLANMSHELRTPLNGILGYAQILQRSKVIPEKERHGVNIIHQCGSHLLTLINDILDLSKIEARKLELMPKALHFPAFLQGVVEICRIRAEQKGIAFHYEPDAQLPMGIAADEKRLRQVLINLLGNAIKFTDKGSVTLCIEPIASTPNSIQLRFTVADTGVGISPDDAKKLFQAFEQVGEDKRKSEGTGLGLTISQQIVELMGSQIQVKSQLGVGSDFFFEVELPLAEDWREQQTTAIGNLIGYEGKPREILVVDDRWENRAVLLNLLEPLGFVIREAENGQRALEQLQERLPDLVITDLEMPVMDGFEMLQKIRNHDSFKELTVIVSSASVAQLDQQMSLEAGGNDFLAKPVQAEDLFNALAKYLNLTWRCEANTPAEPPVTESPVTELIPPPVEDLQLLLELTQKGRLKQIKEAAAPIVAKNSDYQAFMQKVLQLAQQFQAEQIEQLIQRYL